MLLPVALILLPVLVVLDSMQSSLVDSSDYREFLVVENQIGKAEFVRELSTSNPELYKKYENLSQRYDGVSLEVLSSEISKLNIFNNLALVLYFLAIYGLLHMVLSSFYIRELKKK